MPIPRKPTPERYCQNPKCGKGLERRRAKSGYMETLSRFESRTYCSKACAAAVNKPKKYFLTEPMKQILLNQYDSKPETVTRLCTLWNVPRFRITQWAQELGVAAPKDRPWTRQEIVYLRHVLPTMSLAEIGRKLHRSRESLHNQIYRLGINKKQEGYLLEDLLLGFGCTRERLLKWMTKGWLKGKRRGTDRCEAQGDYFYFSESAVRRFIREHPEELNPRRFDWLWIVDLAFGGQFGLGELASPEEVS